MVILHLPKLQSCPVARPCPGKAFQAECIGVAAQQGGCTCRWTSSHLMGPLLRTGTTAWRPCAWSRRSSVMLRSLIPLVTCLLSRFLHCCTVIPYRVGRKASGHKTSSSCLPLASSEEYFRWAH